MDTARQRLAAIRRYTHLGAGFKLALRDLEIRGSGNLLGKEQSGHIAAVGFDMYCKLLKQSVSKLENKPQEVDMSIHVNLDFMPVGMPSESHKNTAALIPDYIASETVRLEIYKRAVRLGTLKKLKAFEAEIRDRFGVFPKPVSNYFYILEIKVRAALKGIHSVASRDGKVYLEDKNGFFKVDGRLPKLKETAPKAKMKEVIKLLKRV